MNLHVDYYSALGVHRTDPPEKIKKSYYRLSMVHHPDRGGDAQVFSAIGEAYSVLGDPDQKARYDLSSRFGRDYDESQELLRYEHGNMARDWKHDTVDNFIKNEVLHVVVRVGEDFDGRVEFERLVTCRQCGGTGRDTDSKIEIKDKDGRVIRVFEGDGGCDFCEGTGQGWNGDTCGFCKGQGKVGAKECGVCSGAGRTAERKVVKGVKFGEGVDEVRLDHLGNHSRDVPGRVGHLWVLRRSE